jgi:hypothetical protein
MTVALGMLVWPAGHELVKVDAPHMNDTDLLISFYNVAFCLCKLRNDHCTPYLNKAIVVNWALKSPVLCAVRVSQNDALTSRTWINTEG